MPTVIFGGGKVDITDRTNRLLGNINITSEYIVNRLQFDETKYFDYDNLLASNSLITYLPIISIHKVNEFIITNIKPDLGTLDRTYKYKTLGNIPYIYDNRHSHDFDLDDTTTFTGYINPGILTIDYNTILNVRCLYIRFAFNIGTSGYTAQFVIKISTDNTNWTTLNTFTTNSASAVVNTKIYSDLTFRYLRFEISSPGGGSTSYAQVRKIIIFPR
jgi:hypothetical protein